MRSPARLALDALDRRLLDEHQRGFPVCDAPFEVIAQRLGCDAGDVIARLRTLVRAGAVSRIGPVFAPGRIGASTLAAMAVPTERLESVAECVNRYPAVNHNYEREHPFNLWFVVAAPSADERDETLAAIERSTGLPVLDLRLERAYHIDLGFPLWDAPPPRPGRVTAPDARAAPGTDRGRNEARHPGPVSLDALDRRLVGAIQDGLPLAPRPYAAVAGRVGASEAQVQERIAGLLREGVVKRLGVVVRHRELGYRANAMVVFDAPDGCVDRLGERLARLAPVTLCYRRTRRRPCWPYNLYCMIHGRDRRNVMGWVEDRLPRALGRLDRAVLFSRRRFRQRGARYVPAGGSEETERPALG